MMCAALIALHDGPQGEERCPLGVGNTEQAQLVLGGHHGENHPPPAVAAFIEKAVEAVKMQ